MVRAICISQSTWSRTQSGIARIAYIDAKTMVAKATNCVYKAGMGKYQHYRVESFTGPDSIGYLLGKSQASIRPQIEALFEREELTFSHWRVLMCLRDGLANTSADISRELAHDKGSMTRIVDQLERRGLLRRQRDEKDRRIVFLVLTAAGRAAVHRMVPKIVAYFNDLLDGFTPEDVRRLTLLLKKLNVTLRELGQKPPTYSDTRAP